MPLVRYFFLVLSLCSTLALQAQLTVETLVDFGGLSAPKGASPRGGLIFDNTGNLRGTTEQGGTAVSGGSSGAGTLFSVALGAPASLTTAHEFSGGAANGFRPHGPLLLASDGHFYGVTVGGNGNGGTVFQLTSGGVLTTLKTFLTLTQTEVGVNPSAGLVEGKDGMLYGTLTVGGTSGGGTLFRIAKTGEFAVLRQLANDITNCTRPSALVKDSVSGILYGVTETGGTFTSSRGTVFSYNPAGAGTFRLLLSFGHATPASDAPLPRTPRGALTLGTGGLLYGTSVSGGASGFGTVFRVSTTGTGMVYQSLTGNIGTKRGHAPESPLLLATDGNYYGSTTRGGASGLGTVFRVNPAMTSYTTLVEFQGAGGAANRGSTPAGNLVQDNERNLYGTTAAGGSSSLGMVFKLIAALPPKPTVTTGAPERITGTTARLTGIVNTPAPPADVVVRSATVWVEYGLTSAYGSTASAGTVSVLNSDQLVVANLSGLLPDTDYHYRVVAQNGGGVTYGADATLRTAVHPKITTPPQDQLVRIGQGISLSVVASGNSPPLSPLAYAWRKNSAFLTGATASSYSIASAALTHAGSYDVRVSKTSSGLVDQNISPIARVGVISGTGSSAIVNQDRSIQLALPFAAPAGSITFQWMKDGAPLVNDSRISGATTDKLTVTGAGAADTGAYVCTATLGSLSLTGGVHNITVRLRPVINPSSLGPWTTDGQAFGQITAANSPTTFTCATQISGVRFNTATGTFSGQPVDSGNWVVTLYATNAAGNSPLVQVPLQILDSSPNAAGTFHGLVARDASNANLGGQLRLVIARSATTKLAGTVTAALTLGARTYAAVTTALSPAPGSTRSITFTITGAASVTASLSLDESTGDVTGTVNGAAVLLKRNPYSTLSPATGYPGRSNVALTPQTAQQGDLAYPQGSSLLSLVISSTGTVTWTGALADGTALSGSQTLGTDRVAVYTPLYTATGSTAGSLHGWLLVGADGSVSSTDMTWLKPAQPTASTTTNYKAGFPLHTLGVEGSRYTRPTTGTHVLGYTGSTGNAQLTFAHGGLSSSFNQLLNFPSTNVITVPAGSANQVRVTALDLTTGIFTGSFVQTPRTASYRGILLQGGAIGKGYFLLPQPTPTVLSGSVLLTP